jgi:Carboxypeptidase regulatory-like domain
MLKQTIVILSLLLLSVSVFAQSNTPTQNPLVINGQVVDENGRPVAQAQVEARPNSLTGALPRAFTDDEGKFSILVRTAGPFRLTASKLSDLYAPTASPFYYPAKELLPEVIVDYGRPTPFTTVHLGPRAGKINFGVVDNVTGQPIQQVIIRACRAESPKYCRRQVFTNPMGMFQMLVPSVLVVLQVSAEGYKDWVQAEVDEPAKWLVASNSTTVVNVRVIPMTADEKFSLSEAGRLPAPQPLSPSSGAIFDNYPRLTRLEWSVVPGAATYTVEIDYCDFCEDRQCFRPLEGTWLPPTSGLKDTSYEFNFIGAQPGRWRVWATDEQGRAGRKSEWSTFFYRR